MLSSYGVELFVSLYQIPSDYPIFAQLRIVIVRNHILIMFPLGWTSYLFESNTINELNYRFSFLNS